MFLHIAHRNPKKTDLERYLEDATVTGPNVSLEVNWDILGWWRTVGSKKNPGRTNMVRDILGIQATSVASESEFSTSGRVVDEYRSSLDPKMVRILMLLKSWLDAFTKKKSWEKKKPSMRP